MNVANEGAVAVYVHWRCHPCFPRSRALQRKRHCARLVNFSHAFGWSGKTVRLSNARFLSSTTG
jgi:hypothetical protein